MVFVVSKDMIDVKLPDDGSVVVYELGSVVGSAVGSVVGAEVGSVAVTDNRSPYISTILNQQKSQFPHVPEFPILISNEPLLYESVSGKSIV